MSPAMQASWDHHHRLHDLPHAGGDPLLAAERVLSAQVRLLDVGEKVRKPACTIEIGGRFFEIVDPVTGRKPVDCKFWIARDEIAGDLPDTGWSDVPADMAALDAEKVAFEEFCKKLSLSLLGHEDPVQALTMAFSASLDGPPPGAARRYEALKREGRTALRDEYARKLATL